MPPRTSLGELELVVLLALLRTGDDAAGAVLRAEIRDLARRVVTPGALYSTLARLEQKRFVRSTLGDPEPVRGGRARRFFSLRPAGAREARRAWSQIAGLVSGVESRLGSEPSR